MTFVGVLGGLSVDHLVVEGSGARFSCLGGPGAYAALGARLVAGTQVRVSCRMPKDDVRFHDLFDRLNIDRTFSTEIPRVPKLWILNTPEGRRIVPTSHSAATELDGDALDDEDPLPDAAPRFYDGLDGLLVSSPTEVPPSRAPIIGVDPHQRLVARGGMAHLRLIADTATTLLPSRVQLKLIDLDPRVAAKRINQELGIPVLARLDSDGCFVVTEEGAWTVQDDNVNVVETTGAGDASAAAAIAALAGGASPVEAAALGVSIARITLAGWGSEALQASDPISSALPGIHITKEKL